ncbi:MAG: hypothetical protein V3575_03865 [Candidatus Absconditabacteria bacterium]
MQKVIQYVKKGFFLGIGMSMGLSIFVIGLFFVKGTDPLTATEGETLTAEKWNALVNKAQGRKYISDWINVSVSSTAPGDGVYSSARNVYTFNHNLNTNNISTEIFAKCADGTIYKANSVEFFFTGVRYTHGYVQGIKNANEILIYIPANPDWHNRTISRLCGTTGQYKVIVTAHD